jgi:NADH-quinone oxidoreductase subunit J
MMNGSTIVFYLLAALTLGCAILSVSTRHIFRAAIYLLFTLIGIAGIYFWLQYEFIAAVQVVVYVGGIVVLIILSIFLTQQAGEKMARQRIGRKIFAALAAFCGFALTLLQVYKHEFPVNSGASSNNSVAEIGGKMLETGDGGYALPFEVISMLLLAAMVGCIVIALKEKKPGELEEIVNPSISNDQNT